VSCESPISCNSLLIKNCLCPCVAERASRRAGTVGSANKCIRDLFFRFLVAFPPRYLVRELVLATTSTTDDLSAAPPPGRSVPSSSSRGASDTQTGGGASPGAVPRRCRELSGGILSHGRRSVADVADVVPISSSTVTALAFPPGRAAAKFVREGLALPRGQKNRLVRALLIASYIDQIRPIFYAPIYVKRCSSFLSRALLC